MAKHRKKKQHSMNRQAAVIATISSVIMALACILVASVFFERSAIEIYEEMENSITGAVVHAVDRDVLENFIIETDKAYRQIKNDPQELYASDKDEYFSYFAHIQNDPAYKELWNDVDNIRQGTGATSIDLVLMYPDYDDYLFMFDASDNNVLPCGDLQNVDLHLYRQNPGADYKGRVTMSMKYGRVRTDGVLVYSNNEEGMYAYLVADYPISKVRKRATIFLFNNILLALIIIELTSWGVYYAVRKNSVEPLDKISDLAEDFVTDYESRIEQKGESDVFLDIYDGNVKELTKLSISLRSMELEMNSYLKDIKHLVSEKSRIVTELDIASKIQLASVPRNFADFEKYKEFELFADMHPAKEVGGDFYDFFMIDDDHLCLVMADVSGKGIPAALYMMVSMIAIKTRAEQGGTPSEILAYVNDRLSANNSVDMFVTVWLGIITVSTGHVIAANAGHEYPVVTDENGIYQLMKDKHGFVLGGMGGLKYKDYEFDIPRNGRLFVYTDGVPEAQNEKEEFFGTDRMVDALNQCKDMSPKDTINHVKKAVDDFVGNAEQFDDTTLLSFVYKG